MSCLGMTNYNKLESARKKNSKFKNNISTFLWKMLFIIDLKLSKIYIFQNGFWNNKCLTLIGSPDILCYTLINGHGRVYQDD